MNASTIAVTPCSSDNLLCSLITLLIAPTLFCFTDKIPPSKPRLVTICLRKRQSVRHIRFFLYNKLHNYSLFLVYCSDILFKLNFLHCRTSKHILHKYIHKYIHVYISNAVTAYYFFNSKYRNTTRPMRTTVKTCFCLCQDFI